MKEVALKTNPTFLVNIALNRDNQITGVFAGDMLAAHAQGCNFVGQTALVPVQETFDIVITTNSGYPLDQNLYQSIKGMRAAQRIVRQGGAIICAAACEEGVPAYGGYADLLRRGGSPQGILEMVTAPGFNEHDMWQVQIQAMVQQWADVYVYSHGLTPQEIEAALFLPCADILETVSELQEKFGAQASIAVIPEGPQTIPVSP
jgi:nickel-dependent lactate racemase